MLAKPEQADNVSSAPAVRFPQDPPGDAPAQYYEVANPGYKLSQGFGLQLRPTPEGVLQAYRIDDVTCVYIQPGLEDACVDLKRQGIPQLYELCDRNGIPYQEYPQGVLRLTNIQPAVCSDYGENLTLTAKGRVFAVPAD